jgi:3-oxoadipate enol-lactonase
MFSRTLQVCGASGTNSMPLLEIRGLRFHMIDEGDREPLVFLHGFPLDHSMWDAQRREFRSSQRVLIPDLRGLGRSAPGDEPVTMDLFADDVAALLDAAGVAEPVALCGLSMGGCIALAFLKKFPGRVKSLILCDARAAADTPEAAENRHKLADKVLTDGPRVVAEVMLPRLFAHETNERHPHLVDAVRNVMLANSSRGIAAAQRALATRPDCTPFLPEIRVPTLLIVGEHDVISPPAEMQGMAAAIPGARCVVIPHAGHMAPLEQPAAVNAALREFLAR